MRKITKAALSMKSQIANLCVFRVRTTDKKLYLGLAIVGVLFLVSYLFGTTITGEVLAFIGKLLLLVTLAIYILSEITSEEP
jgi:predicted membrane channel-forming protein YqfA (hemolysin III family)